MTNVTIITTTHKFNEAISDHFGISEETHSFKQYGRFSESFIQGKYDFWYEKWDAIVSETPEALNMTFAEYREKSDRAYRMMEAWHQRLVNYVIY